MNSIELDIDEDKRPQNEVNNGDDHDDDKREETGANEKGKNADNNKNTSIFWPRQDLWMQSKLLPSF